MKKNIAILTSLLLLSFFKGNAQTHTIDSLQHVLATAKGDSNIVKVDILLLSGQRFERDLPDSAAYYYKLAGALSEKINYPVGTLKFIANYAEVLNHQSKYKEALALNLQSIEIARKIHQPKRLAAAYCNTGASYYYVADYKTCTDYFIKATAILENEKPESRSDKKDLAGLYANLAGIFSEIKQNDNAYAYGLKSIAMSKALNDSATLCRSLSNIGTVLFNLGKKDSALLCLHQAKAIAIKTNNKISEEAACISIANVYESIGNYDMMLQHADKGLQLSQQLQDSDGISMCLFYKAIYHLNQKEYAVARTFAQQGLSIAQANQLNNHITDEYLILSDIELASGNLPEYHRLRSLSDSMKEVVLSQKILQTTQELEIKYSSARQEAQIKQLQTEKALQQLSIQRKRIYLIITIGIIAALLLIGLLYYRNYRRKQKLLLTQQELQQQKITTLEKEKQLMATQAVLQGQEEERSRLAKDLHDGLGGILSGAKYSLNNMKDNMIITAESAAAFERTVSMLDKSISELRRVAHNMMPENLVNQSLGDALKDLCSQVSSGGALQIDYHDFGMENFRPDNTIKVTVYRIVQELINNMMRHAQATTAIVQLIVKDTMLHLTVEDNGKGFDTAQLSNADGIGYKNIQSRIAFLEGSINLRSRADEGTSVYIQIPV